MALAGQRARQRRGLDTALDDLALAVVNDGVAFLQFDPIAFLKIADATGERRQRQGIGTQIHLAIAIPDGQGTAAARADQKIVMPRENHRDRKGAFEALERRRRRTLRLMPSSI